MAANLLNLFLFSCFALAGDNPGPDIIPSGGNYSEPVIVTLPTTIPGADIHYTANFYHQPNLHSPRYEGPFTLDSKTTVKAIVYKPEVLLTHDLSVNMALPIISSLRWLPSMLTSRQAIQHNTQIN